MADGAIALSYEFKRREVLALNLGKSGKTETNFTRNTNHDDARTDAKFK